MPVGRPPEPVPADKAADYCDWIASGRPAAQWHRLEGNPAQQTVSDWIQKDADFAGRVARARDIGYDVIADECFDIADTPQIGEVVTVDDSEKGGTTVRREDMLGHRKLRIETRLKLLACWNPKKYGAKTALEHSGSIDMGLAERIKRARERTKPS